MPNPTNQEDITQRTNLGVWLQPIGYGPGYDAANAAFREDLNNLYAKVAELPWTPKEWLGKVKSLQSANPDMAVMPSPVVGNNPIPVWIATPEQREFWTQLVQSSNDARVAYGKGLADQGRAEMERLIWNAEFWDVAYRFAVAVDPTRAFGRATNSLFDSMGGTTKLLIGGALVVGGLYFASKMFGKGHAAPAANNPGRRYRRRR